MINEHGLRMVGQLSYYRHRKGGQVGSDVTFRFHFGC